MAPNKQREGPDSAESFVAELNHHANLEVMGDCPKSLEPILRLINRTRLGYEDLYPQLEEEPFDASRIYDKQLMWRARELSRACSAKGMNDKAEFKWQSVMSPHVFLSMNSVDDERTNSDRQYHHWYECRYLWQLSS